LALVLSMQQKTCGIFYQGYSSKKHLPLPNKEEEKKGHKFIQLSLLFHLYIIYDNISLEFQNKSFSIEFKEHFLCGSWFLSLLIRRVRKSFITFLVLHVLIERNRYNLQ